MEKVNGWEIDLENQQVISMPKEAAKHLATYIENCILDEIRTYQNNYEVIYQDEDFNCYINLRYDREERYNSSYYDPPLIENNLDISIYEMEFTFMDKFNVGDNTYEASKFIINSSENHINNSWKLKNK